MRLIALTLVYICLLALTSCRKDDGGVTPSTGDSELELIDGDIWIVHDYDGVTPSTGDTEPAIPEE